MKPYNESIDYLFSLMSTGIKLGLTRTQGLLSLIDNPEREFPSILVAGTNGKGSVSSMIASILREAGYRTGLYTSPHLINFNERIRVDGEEISDEDVTTFVTLFLDKLDDTGLEPSFFEFTTAMAFEHFKRSKVDIAVLEVGMGGRLDSTNVVDPILSVITNISLDHQISLGDDIGRIAFEKAGIIREGGVVITGVEPSKEGLAYQTINAHAGKLGAKLLCSGRDFSVYPKDECGAFTYSGSGDSIDIASLPLRGAHQVGNAALALRAAEFLASTDYTITEEHMKSGLKKVLWHGRCELIDGKPPYLLDCAHNPDSARVLSENLKLFDYKRLILVFGCMYDKDVGEMFIHLLPHVSKVIFTSVDNARSAKPGDLKRLALSIPDTDDLKISILPTVKESLEDAAKGAKKGDLIIVAGSIFVVGEAKAFIEASSGIDA
ncbi:MAG: folylpolyglutamate synthase/dihydrofolate synthase family protein [Thermodesulfobacteriota bacterium]